MNEILNLFKDQWILAGATREMIEFARRAGEFMANKKVSSSQIRNVYGEVKRIQMKGFDKDSSSFYLLKPKIAYARGRARGNAVQGIELFEKIFDKCFNLVKDTPTYENFCKLMEAILAYHKEYSNN